MFLACGAEDTFGVRDVVPWTASTSDMVTVLAGLDRELSGPQIGAVAYRKRSGGGHVGIVHAVNGATIEGNTNASGSWNGGSVVSRTKPQTWSRWVAPLYPVPPHGLAEGATGPFVRDLQTMLGIDNPDGVFGPATKSVLSEWQKQRGLQGLGVWGPKSADIRAAELVTAAAGCPS